MFTRILVSVCLLGSLLSLSGCDPKEIVEKKVPLPLKEVLSGGKLQRGTGPEEGGPAQFSVDIASPKLNSVHGVGKDVVFAASVKSTGKEAPSASKLVWTLFKGKGQKGVQIGRGKTISKRLKAGRYRVRASLLVENRKIERESRFRVAHQAIGRITNHDGAVVPGIDMVLTDIGGTTPLHEARSGKDGTYEIEIPAEGHYELTPKKEGYAFYPFQRVVKFTNPPVQQNFKATRAQIRDIKFTETPNSDKSYEFVCPLEEGYVGFSVESDSKLKRVEAYLFRVDEEGTERLVRLDEIEDSGGSQPKIRRQGTVLKVQVPSILAVGPTETAYRLRLTFHDDKNRTFSGQAPESLGYDMGQCFRKALANGVANQQGGMLESAIRSYRMMAKYYERVDDPTPFKSFMNQSTFNRGLAYLEMGSQKPKDSVKRTVLLQKAIADFHSLLESEKKDLESTLFSGLAFHLADNPRQAKEYYDKVIEVEPNCQGVRELRAQAQLEILHDKLRNAQRDLAQLKKSSRNVMELTKDLLKVLERMEEPVKEGLLGAVDDFTEALSTNPDDKDVRRSRRLAIKMAHELNEGEVDIAEFKSNLRNLLARKDYESHLGHPVLKVDTSKIPVREVQQVVNPRKYVRKK